MNRRPDRTALLGALSRVALVLAVLAGLPGFAAAASGRAVASGCLAEGWSLSGTLDQISSTHLIQIGIVGGCIALYLMFRSRGT